MSLLLNDFALFCFGLALIGGLMIAAAVVLG
jgi:hypothetical protein